MSFFMTPVGQRVAAALAGLGSVGVFGASWLPQTIYLDELKGLVQYYQYGFPYPLTEDLSARAQNVLADFTKLNDAEKASIRFFHVTRLDPWHAGTPESGYGAIIGLPTSFRYKSVEEVKTQNIKMLDGKSPNWMSPAGDLLKQSFILSDQAQRFAIAQQIYLANTSHVTVNSIAACGAALHVYIFSRLANKRMGPKVPIAARCIVYGLVSGFCILGYFAITDMARYKFERDSIRAVANLGAVYRDGAIEYFEKTLVRNKALRILLGKQGSRMFTVKGNKNTWVRTPHMPLSICLDQAKRIKQEMEES